MHELEAWEEQLGMLLAELESESEQVPMALEEHSGLVSVEQLLLSEVVVLELAEQSGLQLEELEEPLAEYLPLVPLLGESLVELWAAWLLVSMELSVELL